MQKSKPPLSIRLIYWMVRIVLVMSVLLIVIILVGNILLYTGFLGKDLQLHIKLPVTIDFISNGLLHIKNQKIQVALVDASPKIHFIDTPDFIARHIGVAMLIVSGWLVFQVWMFNKITTNVYHGKVFVQKNVHYLKYLALGYAGLWVFSAIYMRLVNHYFTHRLEFENMVISEEIPNFSGVLLSALLIWVLAHVFKYGVELQQDKELTI